MFKKILEKIKCSLTVCCNYKCSMNDKDDDDYVDKEKKYVFNAEV